MEEYWTGAWYDGVDYSWRFEVSTLGRLRNAKNKKIYILHTGANGYLQICTSINGKNKNIRVHRCVAETFLDNPYGYEIVNHLDGNKQNNRLDNLEWCTRHDNYEHAVQMDLINPDYSYMLGQNSHYGYYRGSYNGMAKLTEQDVIYIRENYIPKGKGQKCNRQELATYFGVSVGLISRIIKNEIWTHV
jgi:hypothetical protein